MGTTDQGPSIPAADASTIRRLLEELSDLIAQGRSRAAFVMAWSPLEAALRSREEDGASRAQTAGTFVQTLAERGYIDYEVARRMREMIDLRNRIVHGDTRAEPSPVDLDVIQSAIEATLGADAL